MIELRWVEQTEPASHSHEYGQTMRVLQYRTAFPGYDEGEGFYISDRTYVKWSDWLDVPVVKDALNGAGK